MTGCAPRSTAARAQASPAVRPQKHGSALAQRACIPGPGSTGPLCRATPLDSWVREAARRTPENPGTASAAARRPDAEENKFSLARQTEAYEVKRDDVVRKIMSRRSAPARDAVGLAPGERHAGGGHGHTVLRPASDVRHLELVQPGDVPPSAEVHPSANAKNPRQGLKKNLPLRDVHSFFSFQAQRNPKSRRETLPIPSSS